MIECIKQLEGATIKRVEIRSDVECVEHDKVLNLAYEIAIETDKGMFTIAGSHDREPSIVKGAIT